jgi:hypothetical protein
MQHPKSLQERGRALGALTARARREARLSVAAKALYFEEDGKTLRPEARLLLADNLKTSELFGSAIKRDRDGRIMPEDVIRFEGRREIVLRLINLLELGPIEVARLVEVDNAD